MVSTGTKGAMEGTENTLLAMRRIIITITITTTIITMATDTMVR